MPPIIETLTRYFSAIPSVERVILYGSRARGDQDERSDIDLAVVCPKASEKDWQRISHLVRDARTLYFIDLVRLDTASKALQEQVYQEGKVVYER